MPNSGASLSRPPPSTRIALPVLAPARKASGCSAGGGCNSRCCSHSPAAVVQPSQTPAAPPNTSIQPQPGRRRSSAAPSSISASNGTGGSSNAVSTGLKPAAPTHCIQSFSIA